MGQNALIFDDLRFATFDFVDLLKLLDNDTSTSMKSRYSNKVFNGKLIIITSSVPLRYWYPDVRNSRIEDITQLYRRIGCYVEMSYTTYNVYHEIDKSGEPTGEFKTFKNELAGMKKTERLKTNFFDMFSKVSEEVDFFDRMKADPSQMVIKEAFAKK